MYINHIVIKNFRALEEINCDFGPRINVIVGPNAVGKTTILQALRLAKALLAPRSPNEATQTLISLGAASPHFTQRIYLQALTRDPAKPIEIRCTYTLTQNEIDTLVEGKSQVVQDIVMSRLGQSFANPVSAIQFLASPGGIEASKKIGDELDPIISELRTDKTILVGLKIEPFSGQIKIIGNPFAGAFIGFLDQRLPPNISIFSYFPADRALPIGESPVQIGAADTQQQLEAHNSQPQLKYTRLKNMIFNTIVMGADQRDSLIAEFEKIFKGILRGRRIGSLGVNELGLLSVMIEEIDTNRKIEIDNLSSGEKNLTLTFLLIAKSIAEGGIVLFDEPELHLNPSVCREVLKFMLEEYSTPRDIQFIMCTHSPEILSGAFSSDGCELYHLKSTKIISKVGKRALDEYSDALAKLGTSVSESLLYEGTILVEGDDDVDFLQIGFGELLKRYKIKDLGGRREIEKTAKKLQELETKGEKVSPIILILDKDDEITDITSSAAVKILQWKRRCIENYLIDLDIITELLKNNEIVKEPISSEGDVSNILRELALSQLNEIAARKAYSEFKYQGPYLQVQDVENKSFQDIASALFNRLLSAKESLKYNEKTWEIEFIRSCNDKKRELEYVWEDKWKELCDGKQLFDDFQKKGILKISVSLFKRKILQHMKNSTSENWRLVESLLKELMISKSET
jgi:predicted ATPase